MFLGVVLSADLVMRSILETKGATVDIVTSMPTMLAMAKAGRLSEVGLSRTTVFGRGWVGAHQE